VGKEKRKMQDEIIPIIELRIRSLGQQMIQAFASRVDELKPFVEKAVSAALSPENLQAVISKQVNDVVSECIKESLGGFEVRRQLETIIRDDLLSKLKNAAPHTKNEPCSCMCHTGTHSEPLKGTVCYLCNCTLE